VPGGLKTKMPKYKPLFGSSPMRENFSGRQSGGRVDKLYIAMSKLCQGKNSSSSSPKAFSKLFCHKEAQEKQDALSSFLCLLDAN
jgi:hypothetical protein